ncbi:hypothetical protein AVEN_87250-1 [Araneus ventricosus]|uniref:Uncharacterized protein n=1 Tax=Araneus ventricosus TaxID=182803 RepID=A0A4Y2Q044_ARAVE|nr:hypothetical protein AVEN_87250-1 [Araneus ventricosus]
MGDAGDYNVGGIINCTNWDNALKFLIEDPIASKENDFDNLAELLIKMFEKKQSFQKIQRQFSTISQKQNQSVKDLANEVSMVADKYVNVENTNQNCDSILKENLKLTKFLEALKPDISLEVKKFGPKDLKSALAHAINIESALEKSCDNSTNNISNVDIHNILKENLIKDQLIADLNKKINNLTSDNVINNIKKDTTSISHEGETNPEIPDLGEGIKSKFPYLQRKSRQIQGFSNTQKEFKLEKGSGLTKYGNSPQPVTQKNFEEQNRKDTKLDKKNKEDNTKLRFLNHKDYDHESISNESKFIKEVNVNAVRVCHMVDIEPGQSKIVTLSIPSSLRDSGSFTFIPNAKKLNYNIQNSLHEYNENNKFTTIIENNSNQKLRIRKKTKIGIIQKFLEEGIVETTDQIGQVNTISLEKVKRMRKEELNPNQFNLNHLNGKVKEEILQLLINNYSVFSSTYNTLGSTDKVVPEFKLYHDYAIQTKPYPILKIAKEYAQEKIKKIIGCGYYRTIV